MTHVVSHYYPAILSGIVHFTRVPGGQGITPRTLCGVVVMHDTHDDNGIPSCIECIGTSIRFDAQLAREFPSQNPCKEILLP